MEGGWFGGLEVGSISYRQKSNSWCFKHHKNQKYLQTEAEAYEYKKEYNVTNGLLKNQVRVIAPHVMEMKLTEGHTTVFDDSQYERIREFHWAYHSSKGCARTQVRGQSITLQSFVLNRHYKSRSKETRIINHISRDLLDNRLTNLTVCSRQTASNNRRLFKSNRSGFNGITLTQRNGQDVAWCVHYVKDKRLLNKIFDFTLYGGRENALKKARKLRAKVDLEIGCANGRDPLKWKAEILDILKDDP
jgi:hypothetical protein